MATALPPVDAQAAIEKCELCQQGEARFFCEECKEEMCRSCKKVHERSKASRNHKVVNIAADVDRNNGDRRPEKPVKCSTHPKERIQMYCINCDVPVCLTCIADVKHENHKFDKLENAFDNYKKEMSQNISETKQQISELEMSLQTIDINVNKYIKQSDDTIKRINKQRKQIKSRVDTIADGHVDQVEKQKSRDLQLMAGEKKEVQKMISDQKEHLQSCEGKLKSMNSLSEFGLSLGTRHKIKKSTISHPPSITHINPPSFVSGAAPDLQVIFGKVIDSQGKKAAQRMSADRNTADQKKSTIAADRADGTSENISTKVVADINPHLTSWSVSAVNNKEAWCGYNKDLALIHIDGHVKKKIKLDYDLYDIAVTPSGELLVTGGYNIRKYFPDGHCINISNTKPFRTRGICITSQQDILVGMYNNDTRDNKVVRMTTSGQIKQTIQTGKQHQPLFTDPLLVEENINGDVCVVSYSGFFSTIHTIVVTNKEGVLRFRYPESAQSSRTIRWCYGIACDKLGYILISDYNNDRIHQIDSDGRFIQYVLTTQHGIQSPGGLSIDHKGQLWVGNNRGDNVTVVKYRS